ncbi:hypothetical protein DTW91_03005 [Chryseobacterium sp. SC28]|nr:hypothetical protein DTW91_03005 [Chryseobacterium sp. SC28]
MQKRQNVDLKMPKFLFKKRLHILKLVNRVSAAQFIECKLLKEKYRSKRWVTLNIFLTRKI